MTAAPVGSDLRGWVQIALFALALTAYQGVRALTVGDPGTATANALDVMALQDRLGIDVEGRLQTWTLGPPGLIEALGAFYVAAHLPVTVAFFLWLWHRRRDVFVPVRNVFLAANALALIVYALYPLAPPRLLGASGLVDTIGVENGVDLRGGIVSGLFNPYAAMPSMHFGYALLILLIVWRVADALWLRLTALLYASLTGFAIIATGNHFFLDAVGGALVLAGGVLAVAALGLPWRVPGRTPLVRSAAE